MSHTLLERLEVIDSKLTGQGQREATEAEFEEGERLVCLANAAPALLAALKEVMVDYRQCGMQDRQVMTVVKAAIQHAQEKE